MRTSGISWALLVIGSIVAGIGIVAALCLPAGREALGALIAFVGALLSVWALNRLIAFYTSLTPAVALSIAMASFAGGYALASAMLPQILARERTRRLPRATGDRSAVLVLSDAEPETYSPHETALSLVALEDDGVIALGLVTTPFLFMAEKARYRAIGGTSPARHQVREIAESLETASAELDIEHFDVAWCTGPGDLRGRVEELARVGYSRFIVVPLGLAESFEMVRANALADQGNPDGSGATILHAAPMRPANEIADVIARKILDGIDDPETTGVVLVAHGQPETRAEVDPSLDEDEVAFANRIRMLMADSGVPLERVRSAWADWRDPDVTSAVRHLAALGCTRILVCPASYPVDGTATLLDLPIAIKQARTDPEVSVVTLPTWRGEPEVIAALHARLAEALRSA